MADSSKEGNESNINTSHQSQRVSKKRRATLLELDVIDCSVCFDTLTIPIFQCNNGHVVCSTCCEKLKKKCATCSLRILSRNRAIERVLELLRVPCPNAEFGCSEEVSVDEKSRHQEQCPFTQLRCPFSNCDFTGSKTDLCKHSIDVHYYELYRFNCGGEPVFIYPESGKRVVLKEETAEEDQELVVVECFETPNGRIIYASSIGPMILPWTEKFYSLNLSSCCGERLCFESRVKRVREVSGEPPNKHFLFVPSYMCPNYKLKICINRKTS